MPLSENEREAPVPIPPNKKERQRRIIQEVVDITADAEKLSVVSKDGMSVEVYWTWDVMRKLFNQLSHALAHHGYYRRELLEGRDTDR